MSRFRALMILAATGLLWTAAPARQAGVEVDVLAAGARPEVGPALRAQTSGYVGADACKDCHTKIYDAWAATKHAKALSKLAPGEREGDMCIRCHVTGTAAMVAADGANPTFPNVQCEACHGAGESHVTGAKAGNAAGARTTPVREETCTVCHNETSPHYKTFIFQALKGLVHRVS